jgi:methionyl-tRNA synthetase
MPSPRYYVTTPIYYVNDVPHIGHAYTSLACDVLARFRRLDAYDVMFLTGTDEHGQKVAKSAAAAGMEPQAFTDKVSQNFRELLKVLDISNDDFIRTTEARHKKACQALWEELLKRDEIYLGKYAGWYAVRDEAYYAENELVDGPNGKKIAPSGAECEWVEEPSYFFKLSQWADRLLEHYDRNPDFILPHSRRSEVVNFVKSGMRDLSISRTALTWGVPVPNDPKHVMYVWLDALTNYVTAVGYPKTQSESYKRYWPADAHVVGKDILRFHAIYWPAFLMAAGLKPPRCVFAHGWWTNEGQKISKSLGNVIDPLELIKTYGLDQTRYFLMREVPFGNDGDFSRAAMIQRINADLANDLGNLAQRSLSMIARNCDGAVPDWREHGMIDQETNDLVLLADSLLETVRHQMYSFAIHQYLWTVFDMIARTNRYFASREPWRLAKTDPGEMRVVLFATVEILRIVAILLQPIMPDSMGRLLDLLAVPQNKRAFKDVEVTLDGVDPTDPLWRMKRHHRLQPQTRLPPPSPIFPRYVEDEAAAS